MGNLVIASCKSGVDLSTPSTVSRLVRCNPWGFFGDFVLFFSDATDFLLLAQTPGVKQTEGANWGPRPFQRKTKSSASLMWF